MTQEDQMMDRFTTGITKGMVAIGTAIMAFILFSAATATDPFLRRKFGERYFTPFRALFSLLGWAGTIAATAVPYYEAHNKLSIRILVFASLILWGYAIVSVRHLSDIRRRQASCESWHSRSRGESILGTEDFRPHFLLGVAVIIALCFIFPWCAAFFALSRFMGYVGEIIAQQQLYNRYLDIRDAQIDAEFMETTLRDGWPPRRTAGVYHPLPGFFKGEKRANIARVVANAHLASTPPAADPQTPQARPQSTAAPESAAPNPTPSLRAQVAALKPAFDAAARVAQKLASSVAEVLASQQSLRLAAGVFVLMIIVIVGALGLEKIKANWHSQPTPPAVQAESPKPATSPAAAAPAPPALPQEQSPIPAPAAAPRQVVPVAHNEPPPPETEPVRPPLEHTGGVKAEIDAFNEFQSFCATTLNAEQARARRLPYNNNGERLWKEIQSLHKSLQNLVDYQHAAVKDLRAGVPADEAAATKLPPMLASRQDATNALLKIGKQIDAALGK